MEQKIKLFGAGGCGCNIASQIEEDSRLSKVLLDTDQNQLRACHSENIDAVIPCGTTGRSTGGRTSVGYRAAEESLQSLNPAFRENTVNCIIVGLGGGAGTGIGFYLLEQLRQAESLTIVVAVLPWQQKRERAQRSLNYIKRRSDLVLVADMASLFSDELPGITTEDYLEEVDWFLSRYLITLAQFPNDEIASQVSQSPENLTYLKAGSLQQPDDL